MHIEAMFTNMSAMNPLDRLKTIYDKGGMTGLKYSIRDIIHYDLSEPDYELSNGNGISKFYETEHEGGIRVELPGYHLYVDPEDSGISTELISGGIREAASYWLYRRHLQTLPDDPVIFEIGSNIGYYAITAAVDRPDAKVLCAELDRDNAERCQNNAESNNVADRMQIENVAISDTAGRKTAVISEESNLHTLNAGGKGEDVITPFGTAVERQEVDTVTGEEFVKIYGYEVSDIDVIRLDVEGHESAVMKGLPGLDPELAHIEMHPPRMSVDEWHYLVNQLESWSVPFLAACEGDERYSYNSLRDLPVNCCHQVVFAKNE